MTAIAHMDKITTRQPQSLMGFTLFETLIYITLVVIIIGSSLVTTYQILETNNRVHTKVIVEQEANFLMQKIKWALAGVSSVNIPAIGASGSTLSVYKTNFSENPIIIDLNSNNLRLKKGLTAATVLNSENITVQGLTFQHLPAVGTGPQAVKINLNVSGLEFKTTIYLRK